MSLRKASRKPLWTKTFLAYVALFDRCVSPAHVKQPLMPQGYQQINERRKRIYMKCEWQLYFDFRRWFHLWRAVSVLCLGLFFVIYIYIYMYVEVVMALTRSVSERVVAVCNRCTNFCYRCKYHGLYLRCLALCLYINHPRVAWSGTWDTA